MGVCAPFDVVTPGTAIGTVIEAAVICDVPLFQPEPDELHRICGA